MSIFSSSTQIESAAKLEAINHSQAVIEFSLDGKILNANENFLNAVSYTLAEIKGHHHSMFVDPAYGKSPEYQKFWSDLNKGIFQAGDFKRFAKGLKEIWIHATYTPIKNSTGKPFKVIKLATDITAQYLKNLDTGGKIAAINKAQAVIEFTLNGEVLTANENFLQALGYNLEEIRGQHHSLFVDSAYKNSADYQAFWHNLARGEFQTGEYLRFGKGGKEVWVQATYSPIMDAEGKPYKIVKFATDTTARVQKRLAREAAQKGIVQNLNEIEKSVFETSKQSADAVTAASSTSNNVQTVAAGAEELSASIREISESMTKSKAAADSAFEKTSNASNATERLAESAKSMNGIVEIIQNITEQINLLALNATIESARAGEAGRGFAVVASEVKNLATQAKSATDQISGNIEGLRSISQTVISSLTEIKGSVELVLSAVTVTASAIEEQSAVVQEMSSSMQYASSAVSDIDNSINVIAGSTESVVNSVRIAQEFARKIVA